MPLIIPLQATPSQTLFTVLSQQSCQLNVYQKTTGMFVDLFVNNSILIGGMIACNRALMIRDSYWGFVGDLMFFDTQGQSDPSYTGLGTRFILSYLLPTDVPIFRPFAQVLPSS